MSPTNDENVGVAFALVIGAGAATGLGAAVVFFPSLVRLASRKTLASALGLSAGVMTYVSFAEIALKGTDAFEDAGFSEDDAKLYTTLCFFAGVIFMIALNQIVSYLLIGKHHSHGAHHGATRQETNDENSSSESELAPCPCHDDNPIETLNKVKHMAEEMDQHNGVGHHHEENENCGVGEGHADPEHAHEAHHQHLKHDVETKAVDDKDVTNGEIPEKIELEFDAAAEAGAAKQETQSELADDEEDVTESEGGKDDKHLMAMSMHTALAIGLHNFPEGLATFVAALNDPKVGAVLAVAIAIHNIPEGLCVAMPIYYATGDKWKAFGWAMLSGISEPFAGLLGWLILAQSFSDQLYGVLFGMVAGMMVIIAIRELLPTAHRYDPEDTVVTYSFIAGMAIMAISLVLFLL